jgi:hypothetical protein
VLLEGSVLASVDEDDVLEGVRTVVVGDLSGAGSTETFLRVEQHPHISSLSYLN